MPVEASAVQISINVVDNTSSQVLGGVTRNLNTVSEAGTRASTAAKMASQEVGNLARGFTAGEGSLRTMNAEIRSLQGSLLGDTRAAAEFLASIHGVGEAMELAFPIFGATAFIGVIDMGVQKVHELYEKWLDVDASVKDYSAELDKARDKDFGNTKSIETTRLRISDATAALRDYNAEVAVHRSMASLAAAVDNPYEVIHQTAWAKAAQDNATKMQRRIDELQRERLPEQQHQGKLQNIEMVHAGDARLQGEQKITAELAKQQSIIAENARYESQQEGAYGNPVAGGSLWNTGHASSSVNQQWITAQNASAEAGNLAVEKKKSIDADMRRLDIEAGEAGLTGFRRIEQEKAEAIAELIRNHEDSVRTMGDLDAAYAAKKKALIDQENKEQDALATRTLEDIQKQLDAQDAYAQRVNESIAQNATRGLTGFARIQADTQASVGRWDQEGRADGARPEDIARGEAGARQAGSHQAGELARRNEEETEQIESQARARSLSAEKNQSSAIEEEYEQRLQKYQQELDQQEISQGDFNRRVIAADEEKNAQLVDQASQAREKMAGEFDQFFRGMNHPLQYLQEQGDKIAGQAAAAMVQRLQTHIGKGTSSSGPLSGDFGMGNIWSRISGHPAPGASAPGGTLSGGGKMIALSTAEIHVQNATIGFGGGNSGPGASGSFSGAPGGVAYRGDDSYSGTGSSPAYGGSGSGSYASGGSTAGSGDYSSSGATPAMGAPSPGGISLGTGLSDVNQGLSFGKQAMSLWGGKGNAGATAPGGGRNFDVSQMATPISAAATLAAAKSRPDTNSIQTTDDNIYGQFSKDGTFNPKKYTPNGGMLNGGGMTQDNVMGAASGAVGIYSAVEGNGGVGGALSGAMSGMKLGMALGGPMGAAIGAAAGAIVGAIGVGGREKARVYDLRQVRPRMAADLQGAENGSMDYLSAYSDLQSLNTEAYKTISKMGPAASSYFNDTVKTELTQAEAKLTSMEKAGRSQFGMSAAQYAVGTDYVPRDGMAVIHEGERITPSDQNERITRALESGAESSRMPTENSGDTHFHIHALDTKTGVQWLMDQKHVIRAANNASYAENSGGSDAGY